MADLIQSYSTRQNIFMTIRQMARGVGHSLLPSLVDPEPYVAIGKGMKLSDAYAILVRTGRLSTIRATNAAIKQSYFELQTGMVPRPPASKPIRAYVFAAFVAIAAAVTALACLRDGTRPNITAPTSAHQPPMTSTKPWWAQQLKARSSTSPMV